MKKLTLLVSCISLLISGCGDGLKNDVQRILQSHLQAQREVKISSIEEQPERETTEIPSAVSGNINDARLTVGKPITKKYYSVKGQLVNLQQGYKRISIDLTKLDTVNKNLQNSVAAYAKARSSYIKQLGERENLFEYYRKNVNSIEPIKEFKRAIERINAMEREVLYKIGIKEGLDIKRLDEVSDVFVVDDNEVKGKVTPLELTLIVSSQGGKVIKKEIEVPLFGIVPFEEKNQVQRIESDSNKTEIGIINVALALNAIPKDLSQYYGIQTIDSIKNEMRLDDEKSLVVEINKRVEKINATVLINKAQLENNKQSVITLIKNVDDEISSTMEKYNKDLKKYKEEYASNEEKISKAQALFKQNLSFNESQSTESSRREHRWKMDEIRKELETLGDKREELSRQIRNLQNHKDL